MEEMMYLSVRLGCAVYLLYKVWGQKARIREWCDLLYTPVKKEETVPAVSGDEPDVMGSTRFVYLDEDAGKTAAPFIVPSARKWGRIILARRREYLPMRWNARFRSKRCGCCRRNRKIWSGRFLRRMR